MVEAAGRSAAAGEASTKKSSSSCTGAAAMAEKLRSKQAPAEKEKGGKKQSSQCREERAESPSGYRSALIKSIFSCRSSQQRPEGDNRRPPGSKKLVGCSAAPSICKLRDSDSSQGQGQRVPAAGEPCKRRASVSERRASKKKPQLSEVPAAAAVSKQTTQTQLQRGGSSSSSSGGGSSFRTGVQLRRLSGCYECHMVVDPGSGSGSSSMRAATAAVCPCPDCGEIFARQESLHFHQSIRHAGTYVVVGFNLRISFGSCAR
jgi:hypothetical protein